MQRFEDEPRVRRVIRSDADAEFTVEDRMNPPDTIDALSHDVIVFAETIMNAIRRREGSTDLAPRLTFFGKEIERAHGWLWDTIPFYTKDLKFDTAALEKIGVDPLRWTGTPAQQMGPGNFIRFISIVGPEGEFVRLGWSPGHHPDKVAGVKLTAHEAAIYAKTVNEIRPDGGLMMVNDVDEGPVMVMEYDGLNMKEAMVELMQTEYYFSAPDESDMVNSKTDMINRIVGYYRHRVNFDRDINLGGADAVLDAVSPRFQRRLLQMRDFRGEEIE